MINEIQVVCHGPNIVALGVALNAGAGAEYGMSTAIGIAIA